MTKIRKLLFGLLVVLFLSTGVVGVGLTKAKAAEAKREAKLTLQLNVGTDISIKLGASLPEGSKDVTAKFTWQTETESYEKIITSADEDLYSVSGNDYLFVYRGISPEYMSKVVTVAVSYTLDNAEVSKTADISVKDYLNSICNGSAEDYALIPFAYNKLKLLAEDLLDYGASAQNYVGFDTENLVNNGTTSGNTFDETQENAYAHTGDFKWYVGAKFDSNIKPTFAFTSTRELSEDVSAQITCNGETMILPITYVDGAYRVTYDGFNLLDAKYAYTLVIKENGVETASCSYSLKTLAEKAVDTKLSALLKDTYVYASSAVDFAEAKKISITKLEYEGESINVRLGSTVNFDGEVKATYSNGNSENITVQNPVLEKVLPEDEIIIGKSCSVKVNSASDETVYVEIPVTVEKFLQGEEATIVGGSVKQEGEYVYADGAVTNVNSTTSAAGDFAKSAIAGKDAYVEFNVISYVDTTTDITLRCANSNLTQDEADATDGYYYMKPLVINTIADLTVNGTAVTISDDVVLAGTGKIKTSWGSLYNVYSSFTFKAVPLKAGNNVVKLAFKKSTTGEVNVWNESPSTMNIDWISVTSTVTEDEAFGEVTGIELDTVEYSNTTGVKVVALAITDNGKYFLDGSKYTFSTVYNGDETAIVTVTYTENPSYTDTKTVSISSVTRYEAENATLFGNSEKDSKKPTTKTKTALKVVDGAFVEEGSIKVVGAFDATTSAKNSNSGKKGAEAGLYFDVNVVGTYKLYIRLSNNNVQKDGSSVELDLSKMMKVEINGVQMDLTGMVVPGESTAKDTTKQYDVYYTVELGNITVNGESTIKLTYFAGGSEGNGVTTNLWDENPAPNIDWFELKRVD